MIPITHSKTLKIMHDSLYRTTQPAFQLQCSKTRCSVWFAALYQRCLKNRGEGCVLWQRGLFYYGCSVLCSVTERISKAGWLQNSLRKPDGKPRDSPWQLLPLCHKQNTRRLSLLPTPTGLGCCQTEQSLSQPLLLSNALSLPLSLSVSPTI